MAFRILRDKPHVVGVEPWGEDYTLLPKECVSITAFHDDKVPSFEIDELEGLTAVWCNDTNDFEVTQDGRRLECGHNRQSS